MNLSPLLSLFRSRRTILEFLEARKIPFPENVAAMRDETFGEFEERWSGETVAKIHRGISFNLPGKKGEIVAVIWIESMGISDVQFVKTTLTELGLKAEKAAKRSLKKGDSKGISTEDTGPGKTAIVVYNNKITPHAAASIRCFSSLTGRDRLTIQTFRELDIQTNILLHDIQSKYVVCPSKKKKKVLAQYAVTAKEMPAMKITDPVAKALGVKKGTMIKIIRRSESIPEVTQPDGTVKELFDVVFKIVN